MTAIVDKNGKLLFSISGNTETIELNTPKGCIAVDDPPDTSMRYIGGVWQPLPPQPSQHHLFDYHLGVWVNAADLPTIRNAKWEAIKQQRDSLEFGGFEYQGNIYDSDQVSQGRIMGAAFAGIDQVWTLADNSTVELSGDELKELYAALQAHIASVHERGRIARQLIYEAETTEQVEAVQL